MESPWHALASLVSPSPPSEEGARARQSLSRLTKACQDPLTLLAGYCDDHELVIARAKTSYDDLVGRSAISKAARGES